MASGKRGEKSRTEIPHREGLVLKKRIKQQFPKEKAQPQANLTKRVEQQLSKEKVQPQANLTNRTEQQFPK